MQKGVESPSGANEMRIAVFELTLIPAAGTLIRFISEPRETLYENMEKLEEVL